MWTADTGSTRTMKDGSPMAGGRSIPSATSAETARCPAHTEGRSCSTLRRNLLRHHRRGTWPPRTPYSETHLVVLLESMCHVAPAQTQRVLRNLRISVRNAHRRRADKREPLYHRPIGEAQRPSRTTTFGVLVWSSHRRTVSTKGLGVLSEAREIVGR